MIGQPSRDLHVLSSVGTSSLGVFRAGREDWRDKAPIAKMATDKCIRLLGMHVLRVVVILSLGGSPARFQGGNPRREPSNSQLVR